MAFILKPILCSVHTISSKKVIARIFGSHHFSDAASKLLGKLEECSESRVTPVFQMATHHVNKIALKDRYGNHTYQEILRKSLMLAKKIQSKLGTSRTQERIVFLCPNDVTYLVAQWACWASGHIGEYMPVLLLLKQLLM